MSIFFIRPRKESGSLVITIPKHVCDKLRLGPSSRLQLILYDSFVVLKHVERIDYEKEPVLRIFDLLDRVFELFREQDELERKRYHEGSLKLYDYDSRMKEIHNTLNEIGSEILKLLRKKGWIPEALSFMSDFHSVDDILNGLHLLYEKYYNP